MRGNVSRRVPTTQLDTLHLKLSLLFRQMEGDRWLEYRYLNGRWEPLVEAHDLICLLDELRMRRRSRTRAKGQAKIGPITRQLIGMKVGDVIFIEPVPQGKLTTYRQTARHRMERPNAVWRSSTQPDGTMRVERVPDGSSYHRDYSNPAIHVLADLKVGESAVVTTLRGKMHNELKIHARKRMGEPLANWRCENLVSGNVRVRRTR
jgi:hypothetical protein